MPEERGVDRLAQTLGEKKAPQIKHAVAGRWEAPGFSQIQCECGETYKGTPADTEELMRGHLGRNLRYGG